MTSMQRNKLVEARADLILADDIASKAYLVHFEAQIHRQQATQDFQRQLRSVRPHWRGLAWRLPNGELVVRRPGFSDIAICIIRATASIIRYSPIFWGSGTRVPTG